MTTDTKLAEMLCTRFCHDIIGPVGALSNGAEFLRDELGEKSSTAADLIESSSKEAVARVQYYRQAYGYAANTSPASLTEMKDLAVKYFEAGKTKLSWDDKYTDISAIQISHSQKKLLLNILIIAASTLIRGGNLSFEIEQGKATITASGEKISLHVNFRLCLEGKTPDTEVDARLIQCHYTHLIAKDTKADIQISENTDQVVFTIKL